MFLPQEGKIVNVTPPVVKSSAAVSAVYVSMENYQHLDWVIMLGSCSSIASDKVSLKQAANTSGSSSAALVVNGYWHNRTALGSASIANDTLAKVALASMSSSGAAFKFASNSVSNQVYVIPVDAAMLTAGKKSAGIAVATLGKCAIQISAILSNSRYAQASPPSAL